MRWRSTKRSLIVAATLGGCGPSGGVDAGVDAARIDIDAGGNFPVDAGEDAALFAWPDASGDAGPLTLTTLYESDASCPPVDYTFRAPRPSVAPGTVLWHRRVPTSGPGAFATEGFHTRHRPIVHPSGAVTVVTNYAFGLMTFDREGTLLPEHSRQLGPDYSIHGSTSPVEGHPFFVSNGNDDVILHRADRFFPNYEQAPRAEVFRIAYYVSGAGTALERSSGPLELFCSLTGQLIRVLGTPEGSWLTAPWRGGIEVSGGELGAGVLLNPVGQVVEQQPAGYRGVPVLGCGYFTPSPSLQEAWFRDEAGRIVTHFVSHPDALLNRGFYPTADCGAIGPDNVRYSADGEPRWRFSEVVPVASSERVLGGQSRPLADGSILFPARVTWDVPPGRREWVILAPDGQIRFRQVIVPESLGLVGDVPICGFEIAPNGVLYGLFGGGIDTCSVVAAIYLGDVASAPTFSEAAFHGHIRNWAHTGTILPDELAAYERHFGGDAGVRDAGVGDARVEDASTHDADPGDAGVVDADLLDASGDSASPDGAT